jgi:hypothetical protein
MGLGSEAELVKTFPEFVFLFVQHLTELVSVLVQKYCFPGNFQLFQHFTQILTVLLEDSFLMYPQHEKKKSVHPDDESPVDLRVLRFGTDFPQTL